VLTAFNSHWEQEIGVPVALDRMALALGAVSLLAREVAHRDGRLRTLPVHWLMFAASLYVLVSMLLADPLDDTNARVGLLDRIGVIPFVLFFLVPFAFRTEEDRRILLGGLVALGGYLGLIALLEATGPRDLIVPNYINDPSLGIHYDRSRGPFLEAGANGISMYACAVAAAVAFAVWRDRRWRVVAGVVTLLCLLGTILTLTRAVWLAALVASPIALLAARELRRYVVPAVVGGLILVTGALAVVPNLSYRAEKRNNDDGPLWDRRNSNRAALNMVRDKPVFGFGWGQFRDESALYYRQSPDYPLTYVKDLHNAFLSNAVELGIVGAALWFVAVLAGIGGAILRRGPPELRPWKIGLIALAVSQAVSASTTPFDFVLPTLLLWMWAGVAWGPRPGAGDEPGGSPEPARA
jgi:O-antigen ligase